VTDQRGADRRAGAAVVDPAMQREPGRQRSKVAVYGFDGV